MKSLLVFGGIVLLSVTASAQAQSRSNRAGTIDPNETICRNMLNTGSRLSRTRVCMTRAQWDERRRDMRSTIERGQLNRDNTGSAG